VNRHDCVLQSRVDDNPSHRSFRSRNKSKYYQTQISLALSAETCQLSTSPVSIILPSSPPSHHSASSCQILGRPQLPHHSSSSSQTLGSSPPLHRSRHSASIGQSQPGSKGFTQITSPISPKETDGLRVYHTRARAEPISPHCHSYRWRNIETKYTSELLHDPEPYCPYIVSNPVALSLNQGPRRTQRHTDSIIGRFKAQKH